MLAPFITNVIMFGLHMPTTLPRRCGVAPVMIFAPRNPDASELSKQLVKAKAEIQRVKRESALELNKARAAARPIPALERTVKSTSDALDKARAALKEAQSKAQVAEATTREAQAETRAAQSAAVRASTHSTCRPSVRSCCARS